MFPSHVVCAWLGNSVDVAREHYLQVTGAHFERAATVAQKQAQSTPMSVGNGGQAKNANIEIADENTHLPTVTPSFTDGEGFEPPVQLPTLQFSRLPP